MSGAMIYILVGFNLGLIFTLMAAPIGVRTFSTTRTINASRQKLWNALWPLGSDAGWSGEIVQAVGSSDQAWLELSYEGRDGKPINRHVRFDNVIDETRFTMQVVDDSSLDFSFWANYRAEVGLSDGDNGQTEVTLCRTDRYRGVAFMIFRYFAARRELAKLDRWINTGEYKKGGIFEHPATQIGFAVFSAFLLWPLFGLTFQGLVFASALTVVVALHELGHMAAFRLMGHKSARMIFIPLLGGIAVGGRPYDSRFEVAFSALMGAGFSAFFIPLAIFGSSMAASAGLPNVSITLIVFGVFIGFFNLANLVPVWKFDGGQVLRQICPNPFVLAIASFALLAAFLGVGHLIGIRPELLFGAGAVIAILSLITTNSGVKPRHELKPILTMERFALATALVAVFAVHAKGVFWATSILAAIG